MLSLHLLLYHLKNVLFLQNEVKKAQKKIAEENLQKAIKVTNEIAEVAVSNGMAFCVSRVDVGLDPNAVREAVQKVMEHKVFSKFPL